MTVVVPFDNNELSKAALRHAPEIARSSESIVALTVIPNNNTDYARERDWLREDETFDPETIVGRLTEIVTDIESDAELEYIVVSRYANAGEVGSKVRKFARANARVVVIGSENAGQITATVGSIGRTVATDKSYNVYIVRTHPNS